MLDSIFLWISQTCSHVIREVQSTSRQHFRLAEILGVADKQTPAAMSKLLPTSNALDNYPDLELNFTHMAHCLTEEVYERLFKLETTSGYRIDDVIQSGVDNPGKEYSLTVGCVAGDEETYNVFAELFDAVIEAYHNGYKAGNLHKRDIDFESVECDLDETFVVSCNISTRRNIQGFCLPSFCSRAERRKVMKAVSECLKAIGGKGEFSFNGCEESAPNDFHRQMIRDWPDARGLWRNADVAVTCNVDDHVTFSTARKPVKIVESAKSLYECVTRFEGELKDKGHEFMWTSHHGYLTTCPSNLGTALTVELRVRIPKLRRHFRFEEIITKLRLSAGDACDDEVNLANIDGLGRTEVEIVNLVLEGTRFLIECEKKLEKGQKIDFDVNKLRQL